MRMVSEVDIVVLMLQRTGKYMSMKIHQGGVIPGHSGEEIISGGEMLGNGGEQSDTGLCCRTAVYLGYGYYRSMAANLKSPDSKAACVFIYL